MKYLTIDTTTKVTALALAEEGKLVAEVFLHTAKTHSERLIPMLDQLLKAASWQLSDLNMIGVVCGPGSFTGIRIGIATAQGLAEVLNISLTGVLSLDSLAWAGHSRQEVIVPILDARKNEWYTGSYLWSDMEVAPLALAKPMAIAPKEWLKQLNQLEQRILFVGDAVQKYQKLITAELGDKAVTLPDYLCLPRGSYAVQEVWRKLRENPQGDAIIPYYIRPSEAEVTWAKKEEAKRRENDV